MPKSPSNGESWQTQFELLALEALKLAPDEREAFVQLLAASLDQEAGSEDALAAEVERRIANVLALVRAGLK